MRSSPGIKLVRSKKANTSQLKRLKTKISLFVKQLKTFIKKYFQNFAFFYKRLKHRIFIRMFLSLGVGLMDGLGLAMFLPLLQMVDQSKAPDNGSLGNLSILIKTLNRFGIQLNLLNVLLVICTFFLLKGCAMYINSFYDVGTRQSFIQNIRETLTRHLSRLSYKSFVMSDSGRIQNTLSGEVDRISQAYAAYFNAFQQFALVLIYMIFAFFVNTQFAILITIGGILTNFLFRTIYVNTKKASGRLTSGSNKYQGLIIQYVANFKYLKATGSMKKFSNKLLDTINYIQRNNERIGRLNAIITATREPLLVLVVCAVIFLQVTVWGSMLATILVSLLFFYRALTALVVMQTYYNTFLAVSGSMENMARFEQELRGNLDRDGNVFVKNFSSEVVLQDVDFYYAEKRILSNINLKIQKNQTIAFVGESGSGKTTLVNLLVGLMPLNNGDMYVDGINRKVLNVESYQQRIGYITQEPVIFNDTVFNNVTFWDEATEENKKKFESALKKAAIYDFVQGLPARENEMLGNSGINLSGGQRQRISIAREMYKDIDILVLDEATSALDSETEKAIQENIDSLKGTYTILIVAHRLSTIKEADCIVLLEGGQIIQKGTFAELYTSSEKFMRMVKLQEISYNHII